MMRRVLNVGHCGYDHGNLSHMLRQHFSVEVDAVDSAQEAISKLRSDRYELVLVNRVFEYNGDSGLNLIRSLKDDVDLRAVPVMLISNFTEAQEQAQALGAVPGFGKKIVGKQQAVDHLLRYLHT